MKLGWIAGLIAIVGLVSTPLQVSADVNDFTVTNFSSDQTLTNKDPQGELRIVERISVDFSDRNHGILRAIPKSYKNHSLQLHVNSITSNTGAFTEYTTYSSNGNTVLKIGDPDRTVTGPQEYTIDYTVSNVLGFYDNHTELYWDVNGDEWSQQFNHVQVTLHLPDDIELSAQPLCYTGSYGSQSQVCTVTGDNNTVQAKTTAPLGANQTLTYVAQVKNGYFHPSTWQDTLSEYFPVIAGITVPILVIGGSGFWYWWRRGRDAKGTGVIVPQYDAPNNLKALQVDGLIDFNVGNTAITATIIDLAIRKYIQIIEIKEQKKLRKDTLSYSLKLINGDFSGLDEHETRLLNAIFGSNTVNNTVDMSKKKNKLYSTASKIQADVKEQLKTDGYFRSKLPRSGNSYRALKILLAFVALVWAVLYGGKISIVGFVIGGVIAAICLVFIDSRTAKGVAAKEHIQGLKLYLNVAEKDRIKKLQAPNAAYADQTDEPARTVELFEKLLPFAMVLGVEKQWSKQFESLYTTPPDWYSGNWTTFNAVYLTSHLNDGIGSAVNTAFSSPSSSGSSGGGGGGFSGGGGGGGGGSGW